MKEEILKRAMFAMPLSKEARGTGIMSGFDMEEMDDDVDENADMEEMPPMARTPQNPEILMNTLRGDMRSVDARYMELAQMVGEEAAMETPPEVLAMLMGQMGAQQQGIGALPEAQGMMPPPMPGEAPMGAPPMGAAPGGAPMGAPPMGAPQMPPPAMEGMPPFPQGGAEQAPPTPDGMPPQMAAVGGIMSAAQRLAQYGNRGAEAVGRGAQAANVALGRMFMNPQMSQPVLSGTASTAVPFGNFGSTLVRPGNMVVKGGELLTPTFTQGISTAVAQGAERFPRAAQALRTMFPAAALAAGATQSYINNQNQSSPVTSEEEARRQALIDQIPTTGYPPAPMRPGEQSRVIPIPERAPMVTKELPAAVAETPPSDDPLGAFITEKLAAFDKRQEKAIVQEKVPEKKKSKVDRIRESQAEYTPLFEELLGGDKESAKINALLLLSEAGLKLASTRKPTFAMALADAASGLPRGMAAIAAQERELGIKTKSAALQQALTDVTSQDAAAAARQNLIAEYALKGEVERIKGAGIIRKDGGAGLVIEENSKGSRLGVFLDPAYVESVKQNPIALSFNEERASPFVRDLGPAATVVTRDPKQRAKIEEDMNQIVGQLNTVRSMEDVVNQAYGPSTFFTGIKNEYFVPLLPDAIVSPNVNKAQVISVLKNGFSELSRGRASQDGRLSVQQEKWQRENDEPIANPGGLLQNAELAAKVLRTKKTALENEWYNSATKLGVFDRNRVIDTPPTGSKNDPFIMPTDAASNAQMQAYLRSTFGSVRDPNTKIYIRDQGTGKLFDLSVQNLLNPRPQ